MNSQNQKKGFACVLREMAGPNVLFNFNGETTHYAQWSWNGQVALPTNIVFHLFLFGRKKETLSIKEKE